MVEAARLSVVVDSDTKALQSGLKAAHGAMTAFGSSATSALSGAAKAGTGLVTSLSKIGIGVFGLGQLGGAIGSVATGMVAGNAQMETYETQLGTLLGSADAAKDRLKELAAFGASTPFELPEVVRAEKVLLGFGLAGQKALQLTGKSATELRTVIGDIAAGTGASFEEIALQFGKFSAGATGESISRLQELGVVTREQLQDMGVQFSKSGELMSPLPIAMAAAVKIAQQKFGGGMDALSKTFAGQMSTLSDNFNQAKNVVTQPIFDVLKTAVGGLNDVLGGEGFQRALQSVAQTLAGLVKSAVEGAGRAFVYLRDNIVPVIAAIRDALPGAIGAALGVIGPLTERISTFFGSLAGSKSLAQTVNAAFGDLIPAGLNGVLDAIDGAFKRVKETALAVAGVVGKEGLAGVWKLVQDAMSEFAPTGERISAAIAAIATEVGKLVPQPIKEFVEKLLASGQAASEGFSPMKALADAVNAISSAVSSAVGFLKDHEVILYAVAGAAAALTAAFLYQQATMLAAKVAIIALTVAQYALNLAQSLNPVMLVVLALGALVGALIYAYNNSEDFRNVVDKVFAFLKKVVIDAITVSITYFGQLVESILWVAARYEELRQRGEAVMLALVAAVRTAWSSISTLTTKTWNAIVDFLTPLWAGLKSTAETIFAAIQTTVETVWGAVKSTTETVFAAVKGIVETTWDAVSTAITTAMANASAAVSSRLDQIKGFFEAAKSAIEGIVNAIKSVVERIFGEVESRANSAKDTVKSILDTVQGWYDSIVSLVNKAKSIISNLPSGGGGGGGAAPKPGPASVPAMPSDPGGGGDYVPPPTSGGGGSMPVMSMGAMSRSVTIQVVLPSGAFVGSLPDFARILQPELARIVRV